MMFTKFNTLTGRLAAMLTSSILILMTAPAAVMAQALPKVDPNTHFQGSQQAGLGLNILAGLAVFALVAIFIVSLIGIANAVRGKRDTIGGPLAGAGVSIVLLIVLFNLNSFLNGLISNLGG